MTRPVAIVVLGMHRSGTSALTGSLDLLGVPLGAPLLAADADNERGYFEHAEVVIIHDELLGSFGASALDLAGLPADWASRPAARMAQDRLRDLVLREFAGRPLWGVKDPRLCLFAPLWEPVLRDLGVEPRYALMLRSPWEVVRSLEARDGLRVWDALNLWVEYTAAAERASRRGRRAVTTFDRILADPETELSFLARALDVEWPRAIGDPVRGELRAFLEPSIRHWRKAGPPEGVDRDLVRDVDELQSLLEALRGPADRDRPLRIDAAFAAATRRLALLRPSAARTDPSEDEYRIRWLRADAPEAMTPGQRVFVEASFVHEGDRPLSKRALSVSYHWADGADPSKVVVWDGLRTPVKKTLSPGEAYAVRIVAVAPPEVGRYLLLLDLVRENVAWFSGKGCAPAARHVEISRPASPAGSGPD